MADCFLGEIRMFAGSYAPEDWSLCNGQATSVQQNQALFSIVGTIWGGDGVNNFNLPDLRGRIPVGQGTGTSLTARVIGQTGGTETVTLTEAQMPAHTHQFYASNVAATTEAVGPTVTYAVCQPNAAVGTLGLYTTALPPTSTQLTADANMISFAGGGQAHNNMMYTTCINFIIAMLGNYPMRA